MRPLRLVPIALLLLGACTTVSEPTNDLGSPSNLYYELIPSSDPDLTSGVLLTWDEPSDSRVTNYVVYSRARRTDPWGRRGETTSNTFHDSGVPHLQYYVASEDANGDESAPSNIVEIDSTNRLPALDTVYSVSLDSAVQLSWPSTVRTGYSSFSYYRVYSTGVQADDWTCDETGWVLEGETSREDFIVSDLTNGVPKCFAVTVMSTDGFESYSSPEEHDTPRFDSRNILIDAISASAGTSGFSFYDPATNRYGLVTDGNRTDIDFYVKIGSDSSLYLQPVGSDSVALYSTDPTYDLTSIDVAPLETMPDTVYRPTAIQAVPGYGYVFRLWLTDGRHYAAVRVTHVGKDYLILDWSYQSDPGNPELDLLKPPAIGGI